MLTSQEQALLTALEQRNDQDGEQAVSGKLPRKLYLQVKYISIYGKKSMKKILPDALQLYVDKEIAQLKEKQAQS